MLPTKEEQDKECKQILSDSIVWEFKPVGISRDNYIDNIIIEMQLYAKWFAKKVIEECAEIAKVATYTELDGKELIQVLDDYVDKESILKLKEQL